MVLAWGLCFYQAAVFKRDPFFPSGSDYVESEQYSRHRNLRMKFDWSWPFLTTNVNFRAGEPACRRLVLPYQINFGLVICAKGQSLQYLGTGSRAAHATFV